MQNIKTTIHHANIIHQPAGSRLQQTYINYCHPLNEVQQNLQAKHIQNNFAFHHVNSRLFSDHTR